MKNTQVLGKEQKEQEEGNTRMLKVQWLEWSQLAKGWVAYVPDFRDEQHIGAIELSGLSVDTDAKTGTLSITTTQADVRKLFKDNTEVIKCSIDTDTHACR